MIVKPFLPAESVLTMVASVHLLRELEVEPGHLLPDISLRTGQDLAGHPSPSRVTSSPLESLAAL